MTEKRMWEKAADIVEDAGGQLIGRTRLQKVAYLLELTDQGVGFDFEYRQFGPYSEELAEAIDVAQAFDLIEEKEETADWGGRYSVFTRKKAVSELLPNQRRAFIREATAMNAVELELAATAAYLKVVDGCKEPWEETKRRKPTKATDERLEKAKEAYQRLRKISAPQALPDL